ncbi:MAG: isoprenyl transferase [Alphaproteobacteria bacterium]|nr:isoprenyl transferase [Alphaproteobacteria bacterium]
MTNVLNHLAIIMDGNGRWAKQRGLPRQAGHQKGAEVVIDIAKAAKELGVKFLTLYAFSTENWKRPIEEVNALMNLLRQYLQKDFKELKENDIRIVFIGERNMLAADICERMTALEDETAANKSATLLVALSYGARPEIVRAAQELAQKVKSGEMRLEQIDEKTFSTALDTKDVPDPDVLIRTGGEQRLSNFLLWQLAYAEFFFTDTLWPDFTKEELKTIVEKYQTRERRYGKV